MASRWDFSRDSPSPTLQDIASKYFQTLSEQSGEGVVTRHQSKIQALKDEREKPSLTEQLDDNDSLNNENTSLDAMQVDSDPPSPVNSIASLKSATEEMSVDALADAPYLSESLVAENEDLKAYIVKTHFKRMKNFV